MVNINRLNGGNITITTGSAGHPETRVKYTEASGFPDATFNIVGELTNESIENIDNAKEIDIGNTVTSIEVEAFDNCGSLSSVTIPNSVTSIGEAAFYGCSGLTSVTIPDNVMSLDNLAFGYCNGLTNVTIGNGVEWIGQQAFKGCNSLTSVIFQGKTLAQVQEMESYPWDISDTSIITVA